MVLASSTVKAQLCTAENREQPCFEQHVWEHMVVVGLHHYISGMSFSVAVINQINIHCLFLSPSPTQ